MSEKNPRGVGNWSWLSLLISIFIVFKPLSLLLVFSRGEDYGIAMRHIDPNFQWDSVIKSFGIEWLIIMLLFSALSIYAGFKLLKNHTSESVSFAKAVLWITGPLAIVLAYLIIRNTLGSNYANVQSFAYSIFFSVISASIWTAYLTKSVRVQNTYYDKNAFSAATEKPNSNVSSIFINESLIQDELYAKAFAEVTNEQQDQGLWAKCIVEADGDKDKATARYIKQRIIKLSEANYSERASLDATELSVNNKYIAPKLPNANNYLFPYLLYGVSAVILFVSWNYFHQNRVDEQPINIEAAPAAEAPPAEAPKIAVAPLAKAKPEEVLPALEAPPLEALPPVEAPPAQAPSSPQEKAVLIAIAPNGKFYYFPSTVSRDIHQIVSAVTMVEYTVPISIKVQGIDESLTSAVMVMGVDCQAKQYIINQAFRYNGQKLLPSIQGNDHFKLAENSQINQVIDTLCNHPI